MWTCRIPLKSPAGYHENERVLVTSTPTMDPHESTHAAGTKPMLADERFMKVPIWIASSTTLIFCAFRSGRKLA